MISEGTREVVTIEVSEVVVVGNILVGNVIWFLEIIHPVLGSLDRVFEFGGLLAKLVLAGQGVLNEIVEFVWFVSRCLLGLFVCKFVFAELGGIVLYRLILLLF